MIDDADLIEQALLARERAYIPYSNFGVGAALLSASGNVYLGCNVENASYPAGICAERTALSSAIAAGERDFVRLVVVANTERPISPCGICRQVVAELAPNARVLLTNLAGVQQETTPQALLPGAFLPDDLTDH